MSSENIIDLGAKSAAARWVGGEAEIWFLTDDNRSVRIRMSKDILLVLARRIWEMTRL